MLLVSEYAGANPAGVIALGLAVTPSAEPRLVSLTLTTTLSPSLPAQAFNVSLKAGESKELGTVTWKPARIGATVFELGIPDRKSGEFRHGEDYWAPGTPPRLGYPTPVWGGQMEFPLDFPEGLHYAVGKSQWTKDWNYVLPADRKSVV